MFVFESKNKLPDTTLMSRTTSNPVNTVDSIRPNLVHRRIRIGYIIGLSLIALITVIEQVVVFSILEKHENTTNLVHSTGRQHMLSQKLARAATQHDYPKLAITMDKWKQSHDELIIQQLDARSSGDGQSTIHQHYNQLEPIVESLIFAVESLIKDPDSIDQSKIDLILDKELEYITLMEKIVEAHAVQSFAASTKLDRLELLLGGAALIVLFLEAVFIFEPMVRRLQQNWSLIATSENRYKLAVNGSSGAIFDWNLENDSLYLAPRYADLVGIRIEDLSNSSHDFLGRISSNHIPRFSKELSEVVANPNLDLDIEIQLNHSDGSERWVICRGAEIRNKDGVATRLAGSISDITELKKTQNRLQKLAERDALTGLANRTLFRDKLSLRVSDQEAITQSYAVMFLDFDRFKMINDSLGHDIGDGLLISFANRICDELPDDSIVARFGGDEFAILVEGKSDFELLELGRSLINILSNPHTVGRHEIISTASIGLVIGCSRYSSAEEILRDADIAMYEAKRAGRAKIIVFDEAMHQSIAQQQRLESELKRPDAIDHMNLVYQPIVSLENGEVIGFETLVRWKHPTEGFIGPDKFIPLAEDCGAINMIGEWILNESVKQFELWDRDFNHKELRVSVNVSRKQLLSAEFLDQLKRIASEHPKLTSRLALEITETAVVDDRVDISSILSQIGELGFLLAMDDFGTGYSSLSCLHNYPIDYLKIDRAFIINIEEQREFTAVLGAIVSLANALNLSVIAEGVETTEQLVQLQSMGCEFAQGYLFAKPLPADEATSMLEKRYGQNTRNAA